MSEQASQKRRVEEAPSKLSIGNEKMLWPDRKLQQGHTRALAVTLQCCQPGTVLA